MKTLAQPTSDILLSKQILRNIPTFISAPEVTDGDIR